jgi:bifunctional DNA-binding transcriptional regulator/antitoxin component of YhaV-PrlF toxin-antitoxin module
MVTKVKAKKTSARKQRAGRTTTSRVSAKNQITIPVDILRKAGFKVGDTINCAVNAEGKIELARPENRILSLLGAGNGIYDDFNWESERADAWDE